MINMAKRRDINGLKLPKTDKKRTWRRWKDVDSSRDRNPLRFMARVKAYSKKFNLSVEEADEFSFTG